MKRGTPEHPKVYDLMEILKRRRPEVLGYLELLWQFTSKYTPRGDVGRFSDARIEAACDWSGRKGQLLDALVQARWIDRDDQYRLVIHDWETHADGTVKKRLIRDKVDFVTAQTYSGNVSKQNTDIVQPEPSSVPDISSLPTGTHMGTGTPCLNHPLPPQGDVLVLAAPEPKRRVRKAKAEAIPESPEFVEFYALYPRHVGRGPAWQAWQKHVHNGDAPKVIAGLKTALPALNRAEEDKRPHPSTWLDQERWRDCEGLNGSTVPKSIYRDHVAGPKVAASEPFKLERKIGEK